MQRFITLLASLALFTPALAAADKIPGIGPAGEVKKSTAIFNSLKAPPPTAKAISTSATSPVTSSTRLTREVS